MGRFRIFPKKWEAYTKLPLRTGGIDSDWRIYPEDLPLSDLQTLKPFESFMKVSTEAMEPKLTKIALLSDMHVPYHDPRAFELFKEAMQGFKPDVLVNLGDLPDFYSISKFSKDPLERMSFKEEVETCNEILDALDSLGAKRKIFLAGNHDARLVNYLREKAPELFGFVTVPKLFLLDERSWEFVDYKQSIRLGKVWLTHDVGTAGRYSVFRAADTFQSSVATAHTHRMNYIVEGDASGRHFVSAQFGWMGDIERVDYTHRVLSNRFWSLGFGVGMMEPSGVIHLQPVPIIQHEGKYSCVVAGKYYSN